MLSLQVSEIRVLRVAIVLCTLALNAFGSSVAEDAALLAKLNATGHKNLQLAVSYRMSKKSLLVQMIRCLGQKLKDAIN